MTGPKGRAAALGPKGRAAAPGPKGPAPAPGPCPLRGPAPALGPARADARAAKTASDPSLRPPARNAGGRAGDQPGLIPRIFSERRRKSSTVVRSATEMITKMVATARMAGLICSRIPFHIWRGMVCWSCAATKSTTTTSSNEVTKAKSAPEITPGQDQRHGDLEKGRGRIGPERGRRRVSDWSKPTSVAVTVMMTKGMPSVACAMMMPR